MKRLLVVFAFLLGFALVSCNYPTSPSNPITTLPQVKTEVVYNDTVEAVPTLPSITPTPMIYSEPVQLTATVWEELPHAPVLMYHRFNTQPGGRSYRYTTSLADFEQHLHALYDAGFSLVSLSDWLRGNIHLQEGRRPLIITIDDLFFADQIFLDGQGDPVPYSGIGLLWQFAQDHPDFNFEVALFYNMGDKGYANHYHNGTFSVREGWREARAEVIVWSIENSAMPMNHFYEHPYLNTLSPPEIHWQMVENDKALREALALVGREDLRKNLPNILALPYVVWPATEEGKQVLFNYVNPEGAPVAAIVLGNNAGGTRYIQAPFSHEFNRWQVPRITVTSLEIKSIINNSEQIPVAVICNLGEFQGNPHILPDVISGAILEKINVGACPYGYYVVNQLAFYVQEDVIIQYSP